MQLERTFSVTAPIGTVWETLMDFEQVAGCIPGAEILEKTSEDEYQVAMKVKLGPVTMQYKGTLHVVERDAAARRATLQGKAREARGQGAAEAKVTMQLSDSGTSTEGSVNADLTLSGKAAAMGKSVIGSVTDQMLAVFTKNLQEMISAPQAKAPSSTASSSATTSSPSAPPSSPDAQAKPGSAAETEPAAPPSSAAQTQPESATRTKPAPPSSSSSPASAPTGQLSGSSLDGLAVARQVLADQLRSPGKVLCLVFAAAALAHLAGRRSGRRQALALFRSGGA
jgi:carbon monoxide dehydrogenase subunit G